MGKSSFSFHFISTFLITFLIINQSVFAAGEVRYSKNAEIFNFKSHPGAIYSQTICDGESPAFDFKIVTNHQDFGSYGVEMKFDISQTKGYVKSAIVCMCRSPAADIRTNYVQPLTAMPDCPEPFFPQNPTVPDPTWASGNLDAVAVPGHLWLGEFRCIPIGKFVNDSYKNGDDSIHLRWWGDTSGITSFYGPGYNSQNINNQYCAKNPIDDKICDAYMNVTYSLEILDISHSPANPTHDEQVTVSVETWFDDSGDGNVQIHYRDVWGYSWKKVDLTYSGNGNVWEITFPANTFLSGRHIEYSVSASEGSVSDEKDNGGNMYSFNTETESGLPTMKQTHLTPESFFTRGDSTAPVCWTTTNGANPQNYFVSVMDWMASHRNIGADLRFDIEGVYGDVRSAEVCFDTRGTAGRTVFIEEINDVVCDYFPQTPVDPLLGTWREGTIYRNSDWFCIDVTSYVAPKVANNDEFVSVRLWGPDVQGSPDAPPGYGKYNGPGDLDVGLCQFPYPGQDNCGPLLHIEHELIAGQIPDITNVFPLGTQEEGMDEIFLGVFTDADANCKYDTQDLSYDNMGDTFSNTGGTLHNSKISVSQGNNYKYYIRCRDSSSGMKSPKSNISVFDIPKMEPPVTTIQDHPDTSDNTPTYTGTSTDTESRSNVNDIYYKVDMNSWKPVTGFIPDESVDFQFTIDPPLSDGTHNIYVMGRDEHGNTETSPYNFDEITIDTSPPQILLTMPFATQPASTSQIQISVTTNEAATCRYDTNNVPYASMANAFDTIYGNPATFNYYEISELVPGQHVYYYVKCVDPFTNEVSGFIDFDIEYAVPDTTPPQSTLYAFSPDPTKEATPHYEGVSADTESNIRIIQYRVDGGSWKYVDNTNPSLPSMSVDFEFTISPALLHGGPYTIEVMATDAEENAETSLASDEITVDLNPPLIRNTNPYGNLASGKTSVEMNVTTDEPATCKYDTDSDTPYDDMDYTFSTLPDYPDHNFVTLNGLTSGITTYYVRCQDTFGHQNQIDTTITFTIASPGDTDKPVTTIYSYDNPTSKTTPTFYGKSRDDLSDIERIRYSSDGGNTWNPVVLTTPELPANPVNFEFTVAPELANGPHTIRVFASDGINSETPKIFPITIDIMPPTISDILPVPNLASGTSQTTLHVKTDEEAECRFSLNDEAFGDMTSKLTPSNEGQHHDYMLTELQDGSYTYYVSCKDTLGNFNSPNTKVIFSIADPLSLSLVSSILYPNDGQETVVTANFAGGKNAELIVITIEKQGTTIHKETCSDASTCGLTFSYDGEDIYYATANYQGKSYSSSSTFIQSTGGGAAPSFEFTILGVLVVSLALGFLSTLSLFKRKGLK